MGADSRRAVTASQRAGDETYTFSPARPQRAKTRCFPAHPPDPELPEQRFPGYSFSPYFSRGCFFAPATQWSGLM